MGKQTIELELPEAPPAPDLAVHPLISEIRERLARLEERTSGPITDPAAAEALRLAGETRVALDEIRNQVVELASVSTPKAPVVEVHPPAPLPVPEPDPKLEPPTASATPTHRPIWHPSRWF